VFLGLVLIFWMAALPALGAPVPAGYDASAFARLGLSARALAMGGAYVSSADDVSMGYYNPAALALADRYRVGGMYSQPFGAVAGITFQNLGIVAPFAAQTSSVLPGASLTWVSVLIDEIPVWDEDEPDVTYASATSSLYVASVGAVLPWEPRLALGLSVKYYQDRILDAQGDGIGFDLAALGTLDLAGVKVRVGVNAMDVGQTAIQWRGTVGGATGYVPWINRIGFATRLFDEHLLLEADVDWAIGRPARDQKLRLGGEFTIVDGLAVRAGWSVDLEGRGSLAAGLGLALLDSILVDYAYVPPREAGATHVLSAEFRF